MGIVHAIQAGIKLFNDYMGVIMLLETIIGIVVFHYLKESPMRKRVLTVATTLILMPILVLFMPAMMPKKISNKAKIKRTVSPTPEWTDDTQPPASCTDD
jgi:hypothetical protein